MIENQWSVVSGQWSVHRARFRLRANSNTPKRGQHD